MDVLRVAEGIARTLIFRYTDADGAPVDPAGQSVAVDIVRDDSTALPGGAATRVEQGVYSFQLTPTHTESLDWLTLTRTATLEGSPQTVAIRVEIVGDHLFTLGQARAIKGLDNEIKFPDETILAARILVEQALEDAIQCALVPRYCREQLDGERDPVLQATWPRISTVRTVTVDGTALTSDELAAVSASGRIIHRRGLWPEGYGNVEVVYEHGYQTPPQRAVRAGLELLRHWLLEGPISQRATTWTNPETGVTQTLLTPGTRNMLFALPEVEAFVAQYDHHTSL